MMSVGQACARHVDQVTAGESVQTAASRMRDRMVGSLVICDETNRPIGIVTDRDLVTRVVATGLDASSTSIGEVMTKSPHCIDESAAMQKALVEMRTGPYRRLPVIKGDGQLVGMITLDDVLHHLAEEFLQIGCLVRRESPTELATT
ncbi:MAG: CBS domain-containing protein [Aeoliella sp.]